MTNPIKLTEKNILVLEDNQNFHDEHGNNIDNEPFIIVEARPIKKAEQLKQQILSNQEKAENWDKLELGISQIKSSEKYITMGKVYANLINENKELKKITDGFE